MELEMNRIKNKVRAFRGRVEEVGNEQLEAILERVDSPVLNALIKKFREEGTSGSKEYLKGLAVEQREKLERAADTLLSRVYEVKDEGKKVLEKEISDLLTKNVLERANKVKDALGETKAEAKKKVKAVRSKVVKRAKKVKKTATKKKKKAVKKKAVKKKSSKKKVAKRKAPKKKKASKKAK